MMNLWYILASIFSLAEKTVLLISYDFTMLVTEKDMVEDLPSGGYVILIKLMPFSFYDNQFLWRIKKQPFDPISIRSVFVCSLINCDSS